MTLEPWLQATILLSLSMLFLIILLLLTLRMRATNRLAQQQYQQLDKSFQQLQVDHATWREKATRNEQENLQQQQRCQQLDQACTQLKVENGRLQEQSKSQQDKLTWLDSARQQLADEFQRLSAKIFEERSEKLQQGNRDGIEQLLKPFREQLKGFRDRVEQVHTEDTKTQAALKQQIVDLVVANHAMQEDARSLTQALRGDNKTQGNWGEMILERLLEESGLQAGREYQAQPTHYADAGNRQQLDVVIHLPDSKDIIIDSKVSLKAYERWMQADNEEQKKTSIKQHLDSVRAHIKGLSGKEYRSLKSLNSLDFVLLFIPIEGAFLAAVQGDDELFQQAFDQNVVLVSPSTLMVTLRTIRNIWRNEDRSRNAMEIADRAGKVCDQISLLQESMAEVGDRLDKAQQAWQKGYKQLSSGRGNLLRQAHQLQDLGAKAKRKLPAADDANDVLG